MYPGDYLTLTNEVSIVA